MFIKHPYTAIFTGPTSVGKTHLVLDMIETQYNKHFDKIIILCQTIRWNKTYIGRSWVIKDENAWLVEPKDKLYDYIKKLSNLEAGNAVLFIVDDIIADENLDKRGQSLLELAISGRHKNHYLWLLTQSYTAIPKSLRRQAKEIFTWYPKERGDMRTIHEENEVLTNDELIAVKEHLKNVKQACLYIRNEYRRGFNLFKQKMSEDRVTKQKDPKRQATGRKGHEKYMTKLKEDILKNVANGGSSSSNSTNGGINTTNDSTTTTSSGSTIINFSYIHGVGAIAVLSLGVCIFIIPKLMTNQTTSQLDKGPEKISKIRRKML